MLLHKNRLALAGVGVLAIGGLGVSLMTVLGGTATADPGRHREFSRLATYPVFQNVPAGVDPADATVAEISAVSEDGMTLAYTDAAGGRIGFLDITDPSSPEGIGSHDVSGGKGGSPTSVSIVGDHALVVVDESTYPGLEDTEWQDEEPAIGTRAGRIDVISLAAPHEEVASYDLGGQPDSIAVSPDGTYAAIAMENQRNEAVTPAGGEEGDPPQAPAGSVKIVGLDGGPAEWRITDVALPASLLDGLEAPEDAEPEYVDINADNQLALTLQENNGVVIIDLPSATVETVWSAGNAVVKGVDTTKNGRFDPVDTIDAPREPDSIQWVGKGLVATANEGDWKGGTRGWTVFRAATGEVVWDAGSTFEDIATKHGLHNNDRAAKKGAEPEGLAFETFGGVPYAFVGSERSNFVAVYDMRTPSSPRLKQVLPATNGPEGLLPIPSRNLLAISSEKDSAKDLVRASVSLYGFGRRSSSFPSVESASPNGKPIGWGALSALSKVPGEPGKLYAASDSAYATGRIYTLNVRRSPAVIADVLDVTDASGKVAEGLDIEGLAARRGGGFWVADEGESGTGNALLRLDRDGRIAETVPLPTEIAAKVGKWGLEGVTVTGKRRSEKVYVALQRPLWADSTAKKPGVDGASTARIGRYTPATGEWEWFGYRLESTSVAGDWLGLSEITAVDDDTLAVVERDKQNGTTAAIKQVYTVELPRRGTTGLSPVTPLRKRLAYDLLPALQRTNGWTQEKLEGFTIGADGHAYAVTDNDGLDDATGETLFLDLGKAPKR
ncbi:esterase-like activity of phytase family protein [Nocardioides sp. NPDC006273]|uniref:esterase-like activity of phytase family protein n=1 Tax=Nocardioides sp. NPDC006273 TaxID=3155598 RepID=UPI0033BB5096